MENKFINKISRESSNIIFGILCGSGLVVVSYAFADLITKLISYSKSYFLIIFIIFYLILLTATLKLSKKGWFSLTYVIVSILFVLRYILVVTKIWV